MDEPPFAITIRPVREHEVVLRPRDTLGGDPCGTVAKRMSLGEPVLAPVTRPEADREALREHLERERERFDFFELHLVMTLRPDLAEPFVEAGLGVRLTTPDRTAAQPVAWSLYPLQETSPVKVTSKIGLNANLGFLKSAASQNTERNRNECFVLGLGERESDFEWRFRRTENCELAGVLRMFAVLKAPKEVPFEALLTVSATVRRPRGGQVRFRAELPEGVRRATSHSELPS